MTTPTDRQRATWFRFGPPDPAAWAMGGRTASQQMRLSDAERAEVAERLSRHFSEGRLDQAEFDERVGRAMAAKTVGDLAGLFDDLPDLPADPAGPGGPKGAPPAFAASRHPARRGRPVLGLLGLALLAVVALHVVGAVAGHLLFWSGPLIWIALAVLIAAAVRRHRCR